MLNQHIFKVSEHEGVDRGYLRHAIEASYQDMRRKQVGMGMMHLRRKDFLGHRVPDLPMVEQKALCDQLDALEGQARILDEAVRAARMRAEELVIPLISATAGVVDSVEPLD